MPPFITAQTFCASQDGPSNSSFLRSVPADTKASLCGLDCEGKADLGKGCWNQKRKFGVTTHFSEKIELRFRKKIPYIIMYFKAF